MARTGPVAGWALGGRVFSSSVPAESAKGWVAGWALGGRAFSSSVPAAGAKGRVAGWALGGRAFSSSAVSAKERVLILGSGWGGFKIARDLDKAKCEVTLVSPANHFLFTPLLPSTAVGTLEFRCIQEPVRTIPHVRYVQAKARSVDLEHQVVTCRDVFGNEREFDVPYDRLVVAVGNKTSTFGIPGVAEREGKQVFFLKHLFHARQIRNRILELFELADMPGLSAEQRRRLLSFVVVGGGPTSCEFVSELHDFLRSDVARWYPDMTQDVRVTLVEAGPNLLGPFDRVLQKHARTLFDLRGIVVRTSVAVERVVDGATAAGEAELPEAQLSDGSSISFGLMVWSAGLAPVKFVEELQLPVGRGGRLLVDGCCRVHGHEAAGDLFAIGDCAINEAAPLAQLAQVHKYEMHMK
ncbi:pyridine nucleotide-disulfide oxidoreductase-domain-containing protein [Pavlovales sp. CCMP2436]|nr:pyridine nucleotide-disulfide oxidoreductase-domain-containing protein [Pavlovales sp. CCMP2436]